MADTVSVSKGVFAFKRRKTRKNAAGHSASTLNYWTGGDDDDERALTHKNYTKCWNMVSEITDNLQKKTHAKVFHDLVEFIRLNSDDKGSRIRQSKYRKHIPTACLLTGVNMPDHEDIFGSLVHLIIDQVTPHIVRLQSQECSTVRGAIYKMVSQLMKGIDSVDPEMLDEMESGPTVKRTQCTMPVLKSWYQELINKEEEKTSSANDKQGRSKRKMESLMDSVASPRKVSKSEDYEDSQKGFESPRKTIKSPKRCFESPRKACKSPMKVTPKKVTESPRKQLGNTPKKTVSCELQNTSSKIDKIYLSPSEESRKQSLVIILEDVESFPTHVLQDLILICSEHSDNLPFVFVFGVATTSAAIHHSLSQEASACVAMETFQAQPSTYYLNDIIDKVLMSSKVPFHIGGRTFKLLLDIFLYHDLSVKNFNRALQVCMIEHFTGSAASFLCCSPYARKQLMRSATSGQLDIIRKLPSFKAYIESRSPEEQGKLLKSDIETKEKILEILTNLELWYTRFCSIVKVVNALTCTLSKSPLGRQVREVLSICLSRPLVETEEYQEVQKMLSLIAREELLPLLNNAMKLLQEETNNDEVLENLHEAIAIVIGRLNSLDQLEEEVKEQEKKTPVVIQATDRFQLKEKLMELAMKKKKPSAYEAVRKDLLHMLDDIFKQHLQPSVQQPLHEVLFFDSSSVVKRHLIGNTRAAVTTALSNPYHYLQCTCCQLEDPTNIVTSLPDVSVAYKLHLECGRLINLYDWMQAFVAVVDPDAESSSKKINKKLQARFVQALLELQFLGFVKQTRRKTDHVARLTWGGC